MIRQQQKNLSFLFLWKTRNIQYDFSIFLSDYFRWWCTPVCDDDVDLSLVDWWWKIISKNDIKNVKSRNWNVGKQFFSLALQLENDQRRRILLLHYVLMSNFLSIIFDVIWFFCCLFAENFSQFLNIEKLVQMKNKTKNHCFS